MKKIIVAIAALSFVFSSCGKDDDNGGVDNTKTGIISRSPWRLSAVSINTQNFGEIDQYANLQSCQQDNRYTFQKDGVILIDEGASKCNGSDPQTTTDGRWAFENAETKLYASFSLGGMPYAGTLHIEDLSETTLKVSRDTLIVFGPLSDSAKVVATFSK